MLLGNLSSLITNVDQVRTISFVRSGVVLFYLIIHLFKLICKKNGPECTWARSVVLFFRTSIEITNCQNAKDFYTFQIIFPRFLASWWTKYLDEETSVLFFYFTYTQIEC